MEAVHLVAAQPPSQSEDLSEPGKFFHLSFSEAEVGTLVGALHDSLSRPVTSCGIWLQPGVDVAVSLLQRLATCYVGHVEETPRWTAEQREEWREAIAATNSALGAMGVDEGLPGLDEVPL
jgi:hypothetical protein